VRVAGPRWLRLGVVGAEDFEGARVAGGAAWRLVNLCCVGAVLCAGGELRERSGDSLGRTGRARRRCCRKERASCRSGRGVSVIPLCCVGVGFAVRAGVRLKVGMGLLGWAEDLPMAWESTCGGELQRCVICIYFSSCCSEVPEFMFYLALSLGLRRSVVVIEVAVALLSVRDAVM
jgi:hypothetical protein